MGHAGQEPGEPAGPAVERRNEPVPNAHVTRRALLLGAIAGTCGLGMGAPPIVLTDLSSDLHVDQALTSWVLAAFALGIALANAVGGSWIDLAGARRVIRTGAVVTSAGGLLVVLAPAFAWIAAAELLLGFGTGLVCLTAFHAVGHLPEAERARASGIVTAVSFSCIASGPFVGAVVSAIGGWRAALALCVVLLACTPALVRGLPPDVRTGGRVDIWGVALATAGATALAALLQSPASGTSVRVAVLLGIAVAVFAVLLARHLRTYPRGFLPAVVRRSRELVRLSVTGASVQAGCNALLFAAPVLLARNSGWSTLAVGAALLPAAVAATVAARLVGARSAGRATTALFTGLALLATAGVALAGIGSDATVLIVAGTMLAVASYAGIQTLSLDRVPRLVPGDAGGAALGLFMYVFITGGAVGSAAAGGLAALTSLPLAVVIVAALPLAGAALSHVARPRGAGALAAEGRA